MASHGRFQLIHSTSGLVDGIRGRSGVSWTGARYREYAARRLFARPPAISSAKFGGVRWSPSPTSTNVWHLIFGRSARGIRPRHDRLLLADERLGAGSSPSARPRVFSAASPCRSLCTKTAAIRPRRPRPNWPAAASCDVRLPPLRLFGQILARTGVEQRQPRAHDPAPRARSREAM